MHSCLHVDGTDTNGMEYISAGPGCSSFGIGAFQEIGPFRVDTDGKTLCNFKYAWNTGQYLPTE
jgi:hypothetical protein